MKDIDTAINQTLNVEKYLRKTWDLPFKPRFENQTLNFEIVKSPRRPKTPATAVCTKDDCLTQSK